jgi:DNA-binding transcriptional LysR family regulator
MIDRYHLRYFLAVIDQGNFSKAAAACNVSQPTLSIGIAKIEGILGRPLFLRTNRRVELTDAGARLASHARRIEADFTAAERDVAGAETIGTIRLGVLVTTPSAWLGSFLQDRRTSGARERIEIVEARERDLLDRLARGRIDLALTMIHAGNDRYVQDAIFTEGYSLAISSAHPLADRDVISAEELVNEPMIIRRQCELLSETNRFFTARGVRPFFSARTMSEARALTYVRSGLGVTVMPESFVEPGVSRPRLADFPFTRTIGLIYAPHAEAAGLRSGSTVQGLIRAVEAGRGIGPTDAASSPAFMRSRLGATGACL